MAYKNCGKYQIFDNIFSGIVDQNHHKFYPNIHKQNEVSQKLEQKDQ